VCQVHGIGDFPDFDGIQRDALVDTVHVHRYPVDQELGSGSDLNFGMNINPELHLVDEQPDHRIVHHLIL
jgi:hypothetical protein